MNIFILRAFKVRVKPYKRLCECIYKFRNQIANMGLLSEGSPLSWTETKALAEHVRKHGIEQFINLNKKLQDRTGDVLKWGDEVRLFESNYHLK